MARTLFDSGVRSKSLVGKVGISKGVSPGLYAVTAKDYHYKKKAEVTERYLTKDFVRPLPPHIAPR